MRDLLSRLRRWRVGLRWYAVALLTAPLVTILTLLALSLTSPAFVPAIITADDKASLLLSGFAVGLIVPAFEELGWTGFVTPRLRLRHGVLGTGLIMGLLWGTWHLPLFAGSAASSGAIPPVLFMAAMLFAWLPPYRVLMVWVYDRTQSLLVVMLMHMPIVVSQFVLNPEGISGEADVHVPHRYGRSALARGGGRGARERRAHQSEPRCRGDPGGVGCLNGRPLQSARQLPAAKEVRHRIQGGQAWTQPVTPAA